jgi:hypothetical protein
MSVSPTNPFVLPGLGQSGEQAANPLLASMEMMRQAFAGLAGSGGFSAGMPMTPSMNPEDLEKRIAELKTVENWLKLNLSMLSSTIQGMEVQLATIATLRSFANSMSQTQQASGTDAPSALEVLLGMQPQTRTTQTQAKQEPDQPAQPDSSAQSESEQAPMPNTSTLNATGASADEQQNPSAADASLAAPAAARAWWDMLQKQFSQVAAATAASLQHTNDKRPAKKAAIKKPGVARPTKNATVSRALKKPTVSKKPTVKK